MSVEFDKSFLKAISKIKHQSTLKKVENLIGEMENASSIRNISNTKKTCGF